MELVLLEVEVLLHERETLLDLLYDLLEVIEGGMEFDLLGVLVLLTDGDSDRDGVPVLDGDFVPVRDVVMDFVLVLLCEGDLDVDKLDVLVADDVLV